MTQKKTQQIIKTLNTLLKSHKLQKSFEIHYKTTKRYNGYGRMYPYHLSGKKQLSYGGLATLPRAVRGFLADKSNIDEILNDAIGI